MANPVMRSHGLIWLSFIIALILQTTPWPGELEHFRPSWVLLVTFYWVMALPNRVNVGTALLLGLLWDLIVGSTLGVRGLMMSLVIYFVAWNFQMLRNLSLWMQAAILTVATLAAKILEFLAEYLLTNVTFDPSVFWAGILNFLLWPWLFLLLRRVRRKLSIK